MPSAVAFPAPSPRHKSGVVAIGSAPESFIQHARNPARNVQIGGDATVFAPVYGPPFVRDLDGERRYATIEDFRNFVKLAYMAPALHHSGANVRLVVAGDGPRRPGLERRARGLPVEFVGFVDNQDSSGQIVDVVLADPSR